MVNKEGVTLGVLVGVVGVMLLFMLGVALPALTGYWSFGSFGRTSVPSTTITTPTVEAKYADLLEKISNADIVGKSVGVGIVMNVVYPTCRDVCKQSPTLHKTCFLGTAFYMVDGNILDSSVIPCNEPVNIKSSAISEKTKGILTYHCMCL